MQSYQANQEPNPKVEEHIASEHAQVSKEKAGEAVQATKESAVEAGQVDESLITSFILRIFSFNLPNLVLTCI